MRISDWSSDVCSSDLQTRERVWLLYAWCRAADDLVDGLDHGGALRHGGGGKHDAKAALARIDALNDRAYAGAPAGEPRCAARGLQLTAIAIPPRDLDDILTGRSDDRRGGQEWVIRWIYRMR